MTDNEIIKALECCCFTDDENNCCTCPLSDNSGKLCVGVLVKYALDLINRQQAEIENFEYKLLGVMHFVDKWLDDAELEQDEVNRASAMREKTLQIVEKKQAEIERLQNAYKQCAWERDAFVGDFEELVAKEISILKMDINTIKAEAVKEFAERLYERARPTVEFCEVVLGADIDNLVKEMEGEE